MTYRAPEGDSQISRVHGMALCEAIGERLGASLDYKPTQMPPHLMLLMARLQSEDAGIQPDTIL